LKGDQNIAAGIYVWRSEYCDRCLSVFGVGNRLKKREQTEKDIWRLNMKHLLFCMAVNEVCIAGSARERQTLYFADSFGQKSAL